VAPDRFILPAKFVAPFEAHAFAPGRVNLIGEHTDRNGGLALPFAIAEGITVQARARSDGRIGAHALNLGERDEFALASPPPSEGWRAFVRGMVAELARAGFAPGSAGLEIGDAGFPVDNTGPEIGGADLEIGGDLARGSGLSSSAALEVSLGLALLALAGETRPDRLALAGLCSEVEHHWVGAQTGLLDQLASLCGEPDAALLIDFTTLAIEPVPLVLARGWRLVLLDSGESHALAESGYNARRAECDRAGALLGLKTLSEATGSDLTRLPPALARRVRHVLGENERVRATVSALYAGALEEVGALLDASHASLRDLYECSTPAVERTVGLLKGMGAVGARMVGGGFGGHVLGLLPPGVELPPMAFEVRPSRGAHLID
jgi:galactokinase